MKKILLSALFVLACSLGAATAQLQKGSTLVGGGIGNMGFGFGSGGNFDIDLTPRVGYFIQDNVAIGAKVNFGFQGQKDNNTFNYAVNGFGRYYFGEKEFDTLLKQGRWFAEAGVGLAGVKGAEVGFNFNFGPGYSYFLSDNVAIEGLVLYNGQFGKGSVNGLSVNLGFQIYFPSSKYKSLK